MRNRAILKNSSPYASRLICRSSRNYAGDEASFRRHFATEEISRRNSSQPVKPGRAGMRPSISPDSRCFARGKDRSRRSLDRRPSALIDFPAISRDPSDRAISDEIRRVGRVGDTCSLVSRPEDMQMLWCSLDAKSPPTIRQTDQSATAAVTVPWPIMALLSDKLIRAR